MITDPQQIDRIIDCFGFLRRKDPTFKRHFFQAASVVHLDKPQSICHEGMSCTHLALVISGTARIYKLGENGREITLYRIGRGESCILTASCIISNTPFPAIAVCEEALEAVLIPTAEAQNWMSRFPAWQEYLFGLVSERLAEVIAVVEEIAFRRVDHRLAAYLLKRAESNGNRAIKVTHQEIASDLGTSREVISRILKDFESRQMINANRGSIDLLDTRALRSFA